MRGLAEWVNPRVTTQAISKYKAGKMIPSSVVVVGLGKTRGVSLDFLTIGSTDNPAIRLEPARNRFAGAFLVPREHLAEETGVYCHSITCDEIIRLRWT